MHASRAVCNGAKMDDIRTLPLSQLPEQLSHIPSPPKQLWAHGHLPAQGTMFLTVVGSRALSAYGRTVCTALVRGLAGYPVSIVSGLALGTDGCAHQAALDAGLHTVAVPGSGLGMNVIGPRIHRPLARRILDARGLLLSEHPPTYAAHPYDFPSRNRIMVGLSHAVLVIEAGPDSGTLITAGLAGEYGRELLMVPHRIGDAHGYGMARFVRIGATLVTESSQILEALGISELPHTSLTSDELVLLQILTKPSSTVELARAVNWSLSRVLPPLTSLEMQGVVTTTDGVWHVVRNAVP